MKNILKKITSLISIWLVFPLTVLAVQSSKNRLDDIAPSAGFETSPNSIQGIIVSVITYALGFVGIVFLILMIYSGTQWIAAGGNEDIITKAKSRFKQAVIGFVVIGIAYGLTILIVKLLEASTSNTYL